MTCTVCETENRPGRKFCRECGNPLAVTCPNCDAANEPGAKYCGNCGEALTAEAERPTSPATASDRTPEQPEQRFVSVLFADIVEYTTLSENRDSEDVRDMLTVYFDRAREIIERFGGTVDKFIGDAVMGVWGATVAMEDDAQRAVRAALELVDMVEAMGEELGEADMALRAGVNSGTTSVGPGGNEKGLVVGDLVNTASRLQSIAEPGTVFVGPATYEVTQRSIDYEDMGERRVKGKSESVRAYRAVRVASLIQGRIDDEVRQPPFVGRERELRLLKDGLTAIESEGRARMISIIGEAGIGKTRLAEEFKKIIDGYTQTIYWHWGRSPSYGDGVTFWALGEIIRSRAGIVEGEGPARSRTRLRTMLAQFVPDEKDREWIEPRLSGLLGLADMPPDSRSELFAALRSLFQNIAVNGPVVIVFEDLHWADVGLLDFIGELVERSTRSPILVVTLARPDLLDRRPDWGTQHRSSIGVRLGPLPQDVMRQLVAEYVSGVEIDVIDQIVERVSGFPLYAVEIVRMLTASGELVQENGQFRYIGDSSDMGLPETLQTVIGARLDRLPPDKRGLLQDGAVLGQTFTLRALTALTGKPVSDLESELGALINLELLDIEDDPRSPERGQYRFVQSLIRETAYGRLNRDDRRSKHLAVAEYFEGFDDPELAGIIASHYMGAYEATPAGPDRETMVDRALSALTDAAARAADLHSHIQAMDLLDQAIELTTDEERKANFRIQALLSANRQAEVERGLQYAGEARSFFLKSGDVKGLRQVATAQSDLLNSHYRAPEALEAIDEVYRDLVSIEDPTDARLAAEAARCYALTNSVHEAIEASDRVLDVAGQFDLPETYLDVLITKATAAAFADRRLEAYTILRGAAIEAENRGLLRPAGRALNNLAAVLHARSPVETVPISEQALELARRAGDHSWIVRKTVDLVGHRHLRGGTYAEGEALLDELDDGSLSEVWTMIFRNIRAQFELRRTGSPAAFEEAWKANESFSDSTDPQTVAAVQATKAGLNAEVGNWAEAIEIGLDLPPVPTPANSWWAAIAVAWTRDRQSLETIASSDAPINEFAGFDRYVTAVRHALDGDVEAAASTFIELIAFWDQRIPADMIVPVKAVFAKLVGTEHPAAAQAAEEAYRWCIETGTKSFLDAFAEVMPSADETAVAG